MLLSREEETLLLQKYEPYLRRKVAKFYYNGYGLQPHWYPDLLQEARLAFLVQMRRAPNEETLLKTSHFRILDALWEYKRNMALVRIPSNIFTKVIRTVRLFPLDISDAEEVLPPQTTEDDEFDILLRSGLQKLSETERLVIAMKLSGLSNREIMPVLGIHREATMSQLLQETKRKLSAELWPDGERGLMQV